MKKMIVTCRVLCISAVPSSEDDVGLTDNNQKWLKPVKTTQLSLSDSDDNDDVSVFLNLS